MRKYILLTAFFTLSIICASLGQVNSQSAIKQENRIALVIGNGIYNSSTLANPENDARAMKAALQSLGFTVMEYENLTQNQMKKAIDDFGERLKGNEVGLFFYAGHGIQSKGSNYLIPVDAQLKSEEEVEYDCVQADRVLAKMEASGTKVNIVILDACRNNPFERSWTRASAGKGLAFMNAPAGSLIAYATSPGSTASDGSGNNGLYTSAILESIKIPNITIIEMFQNVRNIVTQKSNKQQTPWESTSLIGNFYFSSTSVNPDLSAGSSDNRSKSTITEENQFVIFHNRSGEGIKIGQIRKELGSGKIECESIEDGELKNLDLFNGTYLRIDNDNAYVNVKDFNTLNSRDTIFICEWDAFKIGNFILKEDKNSIKYDYQINKGGRKIATANPDDIYIKGIPLSPYFHTIYHDSLYLLFYRKENQVVTAKAVSNLNSKLRSQVEFTLNGKIILMNCSNQDLYPLNETFDKFKINDDVYFINKINNKNENVSGKIIGYDPLKQTLKILNQNSSKTYDIYYRDIIK
jgi:hypothetical protein